jgi:hypothetical protein
MNEIDALMEQLHDIEGLDPISAWPLAIGWWVIIGLAVVLLSLVACYLIRWLAFRRSWKYDILQQLDQLLASLSAPTVSDETIQSAAIDLSEYLRRIAVRRYARKTCAGLTGIEWLQWLSQHDAQNFDWVNQGKLLIHVPYTPANDGLTAEQLTLLVQAAKGWVC